MAERLRRWTRNPLGSPRAGSNPADYVLFFSPSTPYFFSFFFYLFIFFSIPSRHFFFSLPSGQLNCLVTCFCSYSSSGQLYNILKSSIQDAIDAGHFSVSETVTHQVSSLRHH